MWSADSQSLVVNSYSVGYMQYLEVDITQRLCLENRGRWGILCGFTPDQSAFVYYSFEEHTQELSFVRRQASLNEITPAKAENSCSYWK